MQWYSLIEFRNPGKLILNEIKVIKLKESNIENIEITLVKG